MKLNFTRRALLAAVALSLMGAALVVKKVSDYPNVTVPGTNDFFLLSLTNAPATNHNIKYSALKAAINATNFRASVNGTNLATVNLQDSATVVWSRSGSNLTAAAAGISTSIQFSNSVWVSKSGSDSTGARGDASKPFLTLDRKSVV